MNKSKLYHLHIAKTGGTYLRLVLLDKIANVLKSNHFEFIDGSRHLGWQDTEKQFTITTLRDPVKRTVSHYIYYKNGGGRHGTKPEKVLDFVPWVKENELFLANYQAKNFLFTRKNFNHDIFQPTGSTDPSFLKIKIDEKELLSRIKAVDVVLRDTQLNIDTLNRAKDRILDSFHIRKDLVLNDIKGEAVKNQFEARALHASLTIRDKSYIYGLNHIDTNLFFTDSFFTW